MSNKYYVPVYDRQSDSIWNYKIIANSIKQCEEKLVQKILEEYDMLEDTSTSYEDFLMYLDQNDIRVGEIEEDIE